MGKKLYRVRVVLYVMAENESEARVAATNSKFDIFECSARRADTVDVGWNNAIPYNAEDERTCAQILADQDQLSTAGTPFFSMEKGQAEKRVLAPAYL